MHTNSRCVRNQNSIQTSGTHRSSIHQESQNEVNLRKFGEQSVIIFRKGCKINIVKEKISDFMETMGKNTWILILDLCETEIQPRAVEPRDLVYTRNLRMR